MTGTSSADRLTGTEQITETDRISEMHRITETEQERPAYAEQAEQAEQAGQEEQEECAEHGFAATAFVEHTLDTAPAESRPAMEAVLRARGTLPAAVARLAASPRLLGGFLQLSAVFERTTLEPLAREVVIMTVAARNGCGLCVQLHTARLRELGADEELIAAARQEGPQRDQRLEAVRRFTLAVLATAGRVGDAELLAFLDSGHTREQALEVVLGIGTYTMSTFANRLVRAPLLAQ